MYVDLWGAGGRRTEDPLEVRTLFGPRKCPVCEGAFSAEDHCFVCGAEMRAHQWPHRSRMLNQTDAICCMRPPED